MSSKNQFTNMMDFSFGQREPPQHDHDDSNLAFSDATVDEDGDELIEKPAKPSKAPGTAGGKRGRGRQKNATPVEVLTWKDETTGDIYGKGGE